MGHGKSPCPISTIQSSNGPLYFHVCLPDLLLCVSCSTFLHCPRSRKFARLDRVHRGLPIVRLTMVGVGKKHATNTCEPPNGTNSLFYMVLLPWNQKGPWICRFELKDGVEGYKQIKQMDRQTRGKCAGLNLE